METNRTLELILAAHVLALAREARTWEANKHPEDERLAFVKSHSAMEFVPQAMDLLGQVAALMEAQPPT